MTRHKNQTTNYGRPLSPRNPPQTPRARELLARSRGVALVRDWARMGGFAMNCHECGRIIVPGEERFVDKNSGHVQRHVGCHEKAEGKR